MKDECHCEEREAGATKQSPNPSRTLWLAMTSHFILEMKGVQ